MLRRADHGRVLAATLLVIPVTPPDIVLLDLDLLRAEAVGLLGGEHTPAIDAFFRDAAVFDQAQAPAGFTWLSNAAVLTGREVLEVPRGVVLEDDRTPILDGFPALAERLAAAGYATANVNQGVYSGRYAGLDRGFEVYREVPPTALAREVIDVLLELLSAPADRARLILFRPNTLHYPYFGPTGGEPPATRPGVVFDEPDGEGRRRIRFDVPLHRRVRTLAGLEGIGVDAPLYSIRIGAKGPMKTLTRRDLEAMRAAYERQVRYLDAELRPVFDALEERASSTVVVLYANHGESLGHHGDFGHGSAYQECVRVPLLVRHPRLAGSRRVSAPVSLVDLVPTLCEIAGAAADPGLPGRSLVSCLAGGEPPERPLFGRNLQSAYVREGRFKLIVNEPQSSELYDLDADPAERNDLAAARPDVVHRLHSILVRRELELRSPPTAGAGDSLATSP
jgi:arylsulfatase A-like enzyme